MAVRNWLLPENIEDILPPQAQRIERIRATLLELFRIHGYQLVIPPMLEYLESLLTGTGHDLDLRTFKLVDQLSGRMMGVRADITPQVARIDAHLMDRKGVTRLCYARSVLLTRPRGLASTREPLQIGAEIYGHAGIESDLEIQALLVQALAACGVSGARLDIGHVAVFRAVCRHGGVGPELESELYEALSAKDLPALRAVTRRLPGATRKALLALPELYGDGAMLERARRMLPRYSEIVAACPGSSTATTSPPDRSLRIAAASPGSLECGARMTAPSAACGAARSRSRRSVLNPVAGRARPNALPTSS